MDKRSITVRAADLLREAAQSDETAIDFLVAAAAFISHPIKKVDGEEGAVRVRHALRHIANTLSPLCPHCGKHIWEQPDSAEAEHK